MTNQLDVLADAIAGSDNGKFEFHIAKITSASPVKISIGGCSDISGVGLKKLATGWAFTVGDAWAVLVKGNEVLLLGLIVQA